MRLGILGCDTSHVVEFTKRLNHRDVAEEQWVQGATVVAAWPGPPSAVTAPEVVSRYVAALRGFGVAIVDQADDLNRHSIDGVLVEGQVGGTHAALAVPLLEAGVPVFVDKPFACTVADAAAIVDAAARGRAAVLSASSLRFAREVAAVAVGRVLGAQTHTPASLHPANPGLFHYGVHGVEMLYTLMGGVGCRRVRCTSTDGADDVVGTWADGRLGGVRGVRAGSHGYGFTVYGEEAVQMGRVDARWIYHELLQVIVAVLRGEPSPVSPAELVEAVAFSECALRSSQADGAPIALPRL